METYTKDFLLQLYRTMVQIRLCEESLVEPIFSGEVRCPVHLYSGEEAIATGICAALSKNDYIFGTHRSHGHYLAKGGGLRELIAEIYCKETGCCKGRGGSMHIIEPEIGMMGAAPIVAGTISLALGAALAAKIRQEERISVAFFGDGASTEGVLYESINFAALKRLPILFVCENNLYSTHMPIRECRPNERIYTIGKPYGIFTTRVDGNDLLKNYEVAKQAVKLCRQGEGPAFIECMTYRMRGHVGPDDNIQGDHTDIRPIGEVQKWKRKDSIKRFERYLLRNKILSKEDIKRISEEVKTEVNNAHRFAKSSPDPKAKDVGKYVFK
jgi:TPP-dependent pyruvate/acetoin dehydrogenase alpha subunit